MITKNVVKIRAFAGALGQHRGMGWGGSWGRVVQDGRTRAPVTDLCQCMAKTTTIL